MPGCNWSITGCGTCRRTKGIGIFKLPAEKNDEYKEWRRNWLSQITKTREIDEDFRRQINNDTVYTCEKHFLPEDIEIFYTEKMTKKKPIFGAIPKLNMPTKSHVRKTTERKLPTIREYDCEQREAEYIYHSFKEFVTRVTKLN